jgi:hypothetical protein
VIGDYRPPVMTDPLTSLPAVGAPARRALEAAGYHSLEQLAEVPRTEPAALHGVGPRALDILASALDRHGLAPGPDRGL